MSGFTPVTYPARVSSECGQYDPLQDEQLTEALMQAYHQFSLNRSCQEILHRIPSAPSGYYQITAPNVQVYCDMEGSNCGGEGGWMRVAYVNMSQSGGTCPQGLTQRTSSGLTLCGRMITGGGGCQSTVFSTLYRTGLLSSVWTTTRLSVWYTRGFSFVSSRAIFCKY